MKKRIGLACLLLAGAMIGCAVETELPVQRPDAAQTVVVEIHTDPEPTLEPTTAPQTTTEGESTPIPDALPDPVEAPERQAGTAGVLEQLDAITLSVTDGAPYGVRLIAWIDGFGLCYDIDAAPQNCRLSVERAATQDIDPFETHRLLLTIGDRDYCLAELRFDTSDEVEPYLYGVPYDRVIMDSDLVDLEPVGADWEAIAPMQKDGETVFDSVHAGLITSFDAAAQTVEVLTVETGGVDPDDGVLLLPETFAAEPVTLTVPEDAVLAVNGEEYELLITRDRFFRLLEQNYIGFLPTEGEDYFVGCYLGSENGSLRYLCEITVD